MTKLITFLIEPHRNRVVDILKRPFRNALCYGALMDYETYRFSKRVGFWGGLLMVPGFGYNFFYEVIEGGGIESAWGHLVIVFIGLFCSAGIGIACYGYRHAEKIPSAENFATLVDLKGMSLSAGYGVCGAAGIAALVELLNGR